MQKPHCSAWLLVERLLEQVQLAAVRRPSTVSSERPCACAASIRQPHGLPVDLDRARAAHAVLAADVRAGQAGLVADEVRQQRARLDLARVRRAR